MTSLATLRRDVRVRVLAAPLERPELGASTWVAAVEAEWCAMAKMRASRAGCRKLCTLRLANRRTPCASASALHAAPRKRFLEALQVELTALRDAAIVLLTGMAHELERPMNLKNVAEARKARVRYSYAGTSSCSTDPQPGNK
ncbi:MAG: hypothetical protein WDO73_30455 [Ignavibacteriota bacterium]